MCFPDFCFSNRKAYDLYSPENLSGDHRKHRGKCENRGFSPALQMGQFHLKISPKNEKTDRRSGRRRIEKMVGVVGIEPTTFCSQSRRAEPLRYTPAEYSRPEKRATFIKYIRITQYSKKLCGKFRLFRASLLPVNESPRNRPPLRSRCFPATGEKKTHTHPGTPPRHNVNSTGTAAAHNSSNGMIFTESSSERSMPILTPGSGPKKISRSFCS